MKKFLIKISYTVLPLWLLLVGLAVYLTVTGDNSGDLMRLGLIDSGPEYTDSIRADLLPEVYYRSVSSDSVLRADTCDVLVIGDSFSHGGGVGKQGDYVNYLAHDSGRRVFVFSPRDPRLTSPVQVAYDALKQGLIDSSRVKNLVVQEVERYIVSRHCSFTTNNEVDFSEPEPAPVAQTAQAPVSQAEASPLLRVKDYIFYRFFGANPIYKVHLSRPVFGGQEPDVLYFYNDDVKLGISLSDDERTGVVACYRQLIDLARERGVNLILLVAADKYDMYQDWIVDNPYPAKTLSDDIVRWMEADSASIIYAKQVLHPLIGQGVKDVYLFNDTHWSPASSRIIAAEVISKLK